jgi:hypothetical protein
MGKIFNTFALTVAGMGMLIAAYNLGDRNSHKNTYNIEIKAENPYNSNKPSKSRHGNSSRSSKNETSNLEKTVQGLKHEVDSLKKIDHKPSINYTFNGKVKNVTFVNGNINNNNIRPRLKEEQVYLYNGRIPCYVESYRNDEVTLLLNNHRSMSRMILSINEFNNYNMAYMNLNWSGFCNYWGGSSVYPYGGPTIPISVSGYNPYNSRGYHSSSRGFRR